MRSDGQSDRGAGLEGQRRALAAACTRRGWQLLERVEDAGPPAKEVNRPGVEEALRVLDRADRQALVAAKLERLSQALLDLASLLATAQKHGWALVALDVPSNRRHPPEKRPRTCSPPSPRSSRG